MGNTQVGLLMDVCASGVLLPALPSLQTPYVRSLRFSHCLLRGTLTVECHQPAVTFRKIPFRDLSIKRWIEQYRLLEIHGQVSRYATDPFRKLIRQCPTRTGWRRTEDPLRGKCGRALLDRLMQMLDPVKTTTNHWYRPHEPAFCRPLSSG